MESGIVSGWVRTASHCRVLALLVGRRRIATARLDDASRGEPVPFSFDARTCPPDLLAQPTLAFDVAVLGVPGGRFASIEISSDALLTLDDLVAMSDQEPLEGCIDQLSGGLLRGWAHDPSRPERRLELFVFLEARYIGKYIANGSRPDLASTGRGDGRYGFEIRLPSAGADAVVVAGDPEGWRIPTGVHAAPPTVATRRTRHADTRQTIEAFARALSTTEPFPKKVFVLDKVRRGAMPDAFSADYVALSLEFLRHEMVATGETMGGGWRDRLRSWAELRMIGARMRRLEELAGAIADGPRLVEAAARRRKLETG